MTARQRRQLRLLLLAWALFIIYGSWVPLNWQARDVADAWGSLWQWSASQALNSNRIDTAVNVLLTLPLGFGLAMAWGQPRLMWVVRAAIVILLLALSLVMELGQAFLPGRSASLGDVAAQCVGSAAGLLLHAGFGRRVQAYYTIAASRFDLQSRVLHVLQVYLVLLLLFAVMPLDLTLDVGELYGKWRGGRVILLPFGGAWPSGVQFVYDVVVDALLWVPVGLLWRLESPSRPLVSIVWRASLLALGIEVLQLLVLSRVSDVTDVLLSAAGAWVGAGLVLPLLQRLSPGPAFRRRMLAVGLFGWLLATVLIYGWPFQWRWPTDAGQALALAFGRTPFLTYFERGEFGALNEMLRKSLVFLPGGLLLRAWLTTANRQATAASLFALLPLAMLALLLEGMQVVLADRVADLTDAILATGGAAVGWLLGALPVAPGREGRSSANRPPSPFVEATRVQVASAAYGRLPLVAVLVLALAVWGLARVPGVPYNVVKLVPAGPEGLLSAMGLSMALAWGAMWPVVWMVLGRGRAAVALPVWLLLHGLAAFTVLRTMVPLPMLHKVIGAPVLGWSGPWEDLVRYLALHIAVLLPLCGAAALVQVVRVPATLGRFLLWTVLVALMAWPLHWVVVERAATDNLVELMRDGGSFGVSTLLASAVGAGGVCAGALACCWANGRHRGRMLWLAVLSALAAALALQAGLEPLVIKYGRVFSALQFILSASRDAYAEGRALAVRYVLAFSGLVVVVAWLQAPWWRRAA